MLAAVSYTHLLWKVKLPMVMPSITICVFLTLTNSFKLFDQNLALTGGDPNHMTEMLALNIYQDVYKRQELNTEGIPTPAQHKAVSRKASSKKPQWTHRGLLTMIELSLIHI